MLKKFLPIIFLFAGFQVNATLIDNGKFTTDNIANLDWLDLSETKGKSIEDALKANSGWELANKTQFTGMISQFGFTGSGLLASEGYDTADIKHRIGYTICLKNGNDTFFNNLFFDLFGITFEIPGHDDPWMASMGFYDDGGTRRLGGVQARNFTDNGLTQSVKVYHSLTTDYSDDGKYDPHPRTGQFLVRASNGNVPEPSIIALFAAGLFGIGFARRRRF